MRITRRQLIQIIKENMSESMITAMKTSPTKDGFSEGDIVKVLWDDDGDYYPAKITKRIRSDLYNIEWDDGTITDRVPISKIKTLHKFSVGSQVIAKADDDNWYYANVTKLVGTDDYNIVWLDEDSNPIEGSGVSGMSSDNIKHSKYGKGDESVAPDSVSGDKDAQATDDKSDKTESIGLPKGMIRSNSRGPKVEKLQKALKKLHTKFPNEVKDPGEADGQFGQATRVSLRSAQAKAGVKRDGVYGPKTRAAIKKLFGKSGEAPAPKRDVPAQPADVV